MKRIVINDKIKRGFSGRLIRVVCHYVRDDVLTTVWHALQYRANMDAPEQAEDVLGNDIIEVRVDGEQKDERQVVEPAKSTNVRSSEPEH